MYIDYSFWISYSQSFAYFSEVFLRSQKKVHKAIFKINECFKYIFPPSKQYLSGFSYATFSVLINFATFCRSDKGDVVLASVRVVRCWRQWGSCSGLYKNQFVNTSTFIDYSIALFIWTHLAFVYYPPPTFNCTLLRSHLITYLHSCILQQVFC